MDFDLKTLDAAGAAAHKCEALLVLVPEGFKPGPDAISRLVADAMKAGGFEPKAGKTLAAWRAEGITATRTLLAGVGDDLAVVRSDKFVEHPR